MYTHDNKQQPHRIRSIRKPEQQITAFNFSEFPKEEPGVIYVRQSSIAQVQNNIHSYEMQTDKFLEHFREKMECTNVIEIIADDEGISGTKDIHERKGLSRVMRLINGTELLKGQRIGWIGVVHINRLTRDKWLVTPGTIMKDCYENNIWIATLRMNFNFQDIYCQRVFMIEAEESARHLEWMKLVLGGGLNTASSKGYYDGRWLVPGYIVDRSNEKEKKYVIYEPHAEVVKWLFLRYLELDGNLLALCKEVEQKPFLFPAFESWVDPKNISKFGSRRKRTRSLIMEGPNKGCYRSSTWGIRSILCNPVYIGWWLPRGGGLVENNHDPIVDDVLFVYAHRRLSAHDLNGDRQKPARVNRKGEATAILKKVLHDDTDKLMYATFDRAEDKHFRYKSYASSSLTISYRYSVNARELDQAFLTKLFERLAEVKQIEDWEDKLQERQMAKAQSQEDKKSLIRKQIDRAKRQRKE